MVSEYRFFLCEGTHIAVLQPRLTHLPLNLPRLSPSSVFFAFLGGHGQKKNDHTHTTHVFFIRTHLLVGKVSLPIRLCFLTIFFSFHVLIKPKFRRPCSAGCNLT